MLHSYFVKRLLRRSFDDVNNHRWNQLLKAVARRMFITALAASIRLVVSVTTKKPCAAGLSASAAYCPISISRSTTSG